MIIRKIIQPIMKKELREINATLLEQADKIEKLTIEVNEKEAEWAGYEKSISSAQEELAHYQTLRDNEVTNTPVVKDKTNTYSVIFMKGTSIAEANIPFGRRWLLVLFLVIKILNIPINGLMALV